MKYKNEYEYCWETGDYTDQDCQQCPHSEECSGSGESEDDDDNC